MRYWVKCGAELKNENAKFCGLKNKMQIIDCTLILMSTIFIQNLIPETYIEVANQNLFSKTRPLMLMSIN